MSVPQIDQGEVEELLADLVRIPSTNPPGAEAAVVAAISSRLDGAGIAWSVDEVEPGRPNLHVHLGPPGAPALVLNGHSDTMPVGDGWSTDPFEPVVRDRSLAGIGACDMKAGLAAMVGVALALARASSSLGRGLRLDIVVDEEATGNGSRRAVEHLELPDAAVIVEPTRLAIVAVGNGQINLAYTVRGRAAHASAPELGANAVAAAAHAIAALETWAASRPAFGHPLVGTESLSIGTVAGGFRTSVVPDRCRFSVDLRVAPGRDPAAAAGEADAVVAAALAGRAGITFEREVEIRVAPFGTPSSTPLVRALERAHRAVTGSVAQVAGMRATTDAAWYAAKGVPTAIYGAGDLAAAHRADEHVSLDEVETLCRVLLALVLDICG